VCARAGRRDGACDFSQRQPPLALTGRGGVACARACHHRSTPLPTHRAGRGGGRRSSGAHPRGGAPAPPEAAGLMPPGAAGARSAQAERRTWEAVVASSRGCLALSPLSRSLRRDTKFYKLEADWPGGPASELLAAAPAVKLLKNHHVDRALLHPHVLRRLVARVEHLPLLARGAQGRWGPPLPRANACSARARARARGASSCSRPTHAQPSSPALALNTL